MHSMSAVNNETVCHAQALVCAPLRDPLEGRERTTRDQSSCETHGRSKCTSDNVQDMLVSMHAMMQRRSLCSLLLAW